MKRPQTKPNCHFDQREKSIAAPRFLKFPTGLGVTKACLDIRRDANCAPAKFFCRVGRVFFLPTIPERWATKTPCPPYNIKPKIGRGVCAALMASLFCCAICLQPAPAGPPIQPSDIEIAEGVDPWRALQIKQAISSMSEGTFRQKFGPRMALDRSIAQAKIRSVPRSSPDNPAAPDPEYASYARYQRFPDVYNITLESVPRADHIGSLHSIPSGASDAVSGQQEAVFQFYRNPKNVLQDVANTDSYIRAGEVGSNAISVRVTPRTQAVLEGDRLSVGDYVSIKGYLATSMDAPGPDGTPRNLKLRVIYEGRSGAYETIPTPGMSSRLTYPRNTIFRVEGMASTMMEDIDGDLTLMDETYMYLREYDRNELLLPDILEGTGTTVTVKDFRTGTARPIDEVEPTNSLLGGCY